MNLRRNIRKTMYIENIIPASMDADSNFSKKWITMLFGIYNRVLMSKLKRKSFILFIGNFNSLIVSTFVHLRDLLRCRNGVSTTVISPQTTIVGMSVVGVLAHQLMLPQLKKGYRGIAMLTRRHNSFLL